MYFFCILATPDHVKIDLFYNKKHTVWWHVPCQNGCILWHVQAAGTDSDSRWLPQTLQSECSHGAAFPGSEQQKQVHADIRFSRQLYGTRLFDFKRLKILQIWYAKKGFYGISYSFMLSTLSLIYIKKNGQGEIMKWVCSFIFKYP